MSSIKPEACVLTRDRKVLPVLGLRRLWFRMNTYYTYKQCLLPDDRRNKASSIDMMGRRLMRVSVSKHLLNVPEGGGCEGGCGERGGPGIAAPATLS